MPYKHTTKTSTTLHPDGRYESKTVEETTRLPAAGLGKFFSCGPDTLQRFVGPCGGWAGASGRGMGGMARCSVARARPTCLSHPTPPVATRSSHVQIHVAKETPFCLRVECGGGVAGAVARDRGLRQAEAAVRSPRLLAGPKTPDVYPPSESRVLAEPAQQRRANRGRCAHTAGARAQDARRLTLSTRRTRPSLHGLPLSEFYFACLVSLLFFELRCVSLSWRCSAYPRAAVVCARARRRPCQSGSTSPLHALVLRLSAVSFSTLLG